MMSAQAGFGRLELADNARIKRSMKPKTGKPRVRIHFNGCALVKDASGDKFWLYDSWLKWVNEWQASKARVEVEAMLERYKRGQQWLD